MSATIHNTPYYLGVLAIFVALKLSFTVASNDDLTFLLMPVDNLVGLMTGSPSVYLLDSGYFHESLNIVIEKSCSGFNFWCLSFAVFAYLAIKYAVHPMHKVISLPVALIFAYILTIFATAIVAQRQTAHIFTNAQYLIHEAVGVVTYLSFLVAVY
jgi:exosortase K